MSRPWISERALLLFAIAVGFGALILERTASAEVRGEAVLERPSMDASQPASGTCAHRMTLCRRLRASGHLVLVLRGCR